MNNRSVVGMFERVQQYLEAVRELQAVARDKSVTEEGVPESVTLQLAASATILRQISRDLVAIEPSAEFASPFEEQTDLAYRTYREAKSRLEPDASP